MSRISKALRLPLAHQILLMKAAFLLIIIRVGLSTLPFQTLRRVLAGLAKGPPLRLRQDQRSDDPAQIAWAVETMGRCIVRERPCLTQALAAQLLLRRRGYSALLQIGVTKSQQGELQAHAWLEVEGNIIVGGSSLASFTPLPALDELI